MGTRFAIRFPNICRCLGALLREEQQTRLPRYIAPVQCLSMT